MSESELPIAAQDQIAAARAARERAEKNLKELDKLERSALPVWRRLDLRRLHNGLGEEYDLSLTPKGA